MDQNLIPKGNMDRKPVILCLSARGLALATRLAPVIDGDVHGLSSRCPDAPYHFDDTISHIADLFVSGRPVIGICAAAILIRAIAPFLGGKSNDAPVISLAEDGQSIVPLLGLHHGALALASQIKLHGGGHLAITTASDLGSQVALDMPPAGWRLANPLAATTAMATLLAGGKAQIDGDALTARNAGISGGDAIRQWLGPLLDDADAKGEQKIRLTFDHRFNAPEPGQLVFCPQSFILGVGCARGCDSDGLYNFIMAELRACKVNPAAIAAIASVDLKADEPAILALAVRLDVPFKVFTAGELEAVTPLVPTPSKTVFAEIGTHSVAEAAALLMAKSCHGDIDRGNGAILMVPKQKSTVPVTATMALAQCAMPVVDPSGLAGRKPGRVMLIGIGPGKSDWRTPEASKWVQSADELVGYGLYIDILGAIAAHISRKDFALGEEEARCRYALETAATGKNVAIICSGDAGIYAMGALVYELLDRPSGGGGVSPAAHRVQVVSAPGVSALQGAAARSGAILGHDFCTISLSDLLTPWKQIETRVHAAGAGDFVIAFYNPVSRRRRTQLAAARDILLEYRGADVPVLLASNLGRPEEQLKFRKLGMLDSDEVDMLTVVMVGSSASKMIDLGREMAIYTPRGYAKKIEKNHDNK